MELFYDLTNMWDIVSATDIAAYIVAAEGEKISEKEEIKKVSKKARKNHSRNKGERTKAKKEKRLERAATFFNDPAVARIENNEVVFIDGKGEKEILPAREVTWYSKKLYHDTYNKLCKAEKIRDAEKRLARFEGSSFEEENFSIIKDRYYAATEDLAEAEEAVIEAEEKHEELNAEVDWLQYAPAVGYTIEQAHNIYMETLKEREDFIPTLRKARLEYNEALYAYSEAKAAYDMLPFWA